MLKYLKNRHEAHSTKNFFFRKELSMFRLTVDKDINLVLLQESLAETIFQLVENNREYLTKWLPWPPETKTVEDTKDFIKKALTSFAEGERMSCAIEYQGEIVGVIGFNKIQKDLKKVEIGYWLSEEKQGKGIVTRACKRLIQYAFEEMGMEKVEIQVQPGNSDSQKICERLGFTKEGTITNSGNLHGTIIDLMIYAIRLDKSKDADK